ncbi:MAG: hypothetical protein HY040_09100 [Planctomycetes bacterium]|nr:hypothetical protein [Planctomycetota bacterium]
MSCHLLPVLAACFLLAPGDSASGKDCSFLYEPAYCIDHCLRGKATAYVPQPGDILLATDPDRFWTITHNLAFAYEPHNSGLVVARPDGSLALLEAGPNDTLWIGVVDLLPHLREYEAKGRVWIRKRRTPLTPEESACLTNFAMRQEGKRFALIRMGGMLTPIRARGPLRTYFLGKPRGERDAYYCAELVMEAIVATGLVDAETSRPGATFPHDLFFDHSHNLYLSRRFSLAHGWEPPARWVSANP